MTDAEIIQDVMSQTILVSIKAGSGELSEEESKSELAKIATQALIRLNNKKEK